ncbi:epoxide hydrolase [Pyrenochaeta sp. DS3sAY3a]|nr:epoxide hydrolase [Pyrenochaeta sp. DS3sAY3a]
MDGFEQKTLLTQRSLKYTYYISPPKPSPQSHPALLFLHGFPDSAHLWSAVLSHLTHLPNRLIIPDCLGYAGTDKPADTSLYAYSGQAQDLIDILDAEDVATSIIIGHDWGSALAQRTYLHHPERFSGVVLLNTAYMVPSPQRFDLGAVNEATTRTLGYPQFAYWEFFLAPDAASIIDANLERMWAVLHGQGEDWMKKLFCVRGAMRAFMLGEEEVPLKSYAVDSASAWKQHFMADFGTSGFAPALQMYKAMAENVQFDSDATIPRENLKINVPLLFVVCSQDAVCAREMMDQAKSEGLVPDLKEVSVECAHWSPMEKPEEVAGHIGDFVRERFS